MDDQATTSSPDVNLPVASKGRVGSVQSAKGQEVKSKKFGLGTYDDYCDTLHDKIDYFRIGLRALTAWKLNIVKHAPVQVALEEPSTPRCTPGTA